MVEESDRIGVANLFRIDAIKVLQLSMNFESTLRNLKSLGVHDIDSIALNTNGINALLTDNAKELTVACEDILSSIGLRPASNLAPLQLWQSATQVIDFAVLSYMGAHIERFDEKFFGADIACFRLPNSGPYFCDVVDGQAGVEPSLVKSQDIGFSYNGATESQFNSSWQPFTLRRRRLQC